MILNRFIFLILVISFFSSSLMAQSVNDLENQKKKTDNRNKPIGDHILKMSDTEINFKGTDFVYRCLG